MLENLLLVRKFQVKAFTLLESLVTLFVVSFLVLALSGGVQQTFSKVQEQLFLLEFEHFYKESQQLAASSQTKVNLQFSKSEISNSVSSLAVPDSVAPPAGLIIDFDRAGGNSSLKKISFDLPDKQVHYQLFLGNGKFKKTETVK
ncbi:competence type IV pilus minor pilin ComGD [Streptococcus sp. DD10]|uniref:competence type IV pilus minor pilin ComGD n=1 Tax=Streptococcus sp. DD10 TaxID=1777878 RepID=UPI0008313245|nr:competence type IV pilus minor pilin ComGD [Streptococcus sp. DD10]